MDMIALTALIDRSAPLVAAKAGTRCLDLQQPDRRLDSRLRGNERNWRQRRETLR